MAASRSLVVEHLVQRVQDLDQVVRHEGDVSFDDRQPAASSAWRMVASSISLAHETSRSSMLVQCHPSFILVVVGWCGRRESNPHRERGVLASSPLNDDHLSW